MECEASESFQLCAQELLNLEEHATPIFIWKYYYNKITWYLTILRSIIEHPSAHNKVGNVSNPSERHKVSISLIPFWHSDVSARVKSPVDFVYARSRIIHQNQESTGATLPIALSPKSATIVSILRTGSWSTLKLAGIAPSPSLNLSTLFSHPWSSRVFSRKFLTISASPLIRKARALGTKSRTKTYMTDKSQTKLWIHANSDVEINWF